MDMLKIISTVMVSLIACILVKQLKPEFLPFLQLATVILVAVLSLDLVKNLISDITAKFLHDDLIENEYVFLLVRVLGLSVVTKLASDICKDNGNSLLADNIELVGRTVIVALCLPLVKVIADLASGLLE